jgi:UDP-N-acetylglucosamine 2-epimerase (non-hydrolysing)
MAILVHGDTTSAMSAALAAFHLGIPVVHVEAGLRSGDSLTPFPEEMNRQLITCLSSFHLAPTWRSMENLVRENVSPEHVLVTGNTGIDALKWAATLQTDIAEPQLRRLYHSDRRLVIITAHRRENWDSGINGIAFGVRRLAAENPDICFAVPQHPNPLIRQKWAALSEADNVFLTEPVPYAQFAKLLARSFFVITDSGGIQEEAPSLGKPVLVARESTERTEGLEAGTLLLTGPDPDAIFLEGMKLIQDERAYREISEAQNPYGDGRASGRILAAMENLYGGGPIPEPFGAEDPRFAAADLAGSHNPGEARPGPAPSIFPGSPGRAHPDRLPDEPRVHSSEITESEPAT